MARTQQEDTVEQHSSIHAPIPPFEPIVLLIFFPFLLLGNEFLVELGDQVYFHDIVIEDLALRGDVVGGAIMLLE